MVNQLNQNQTLNYLADLPSLLSQARSFLDLKNRQGKETDFDQIDQVLRVYALNLTLISLEEYESLAFEEVFERLEWLFKQEELTGGGSVPVNLAELGDELSRKKEKEAEEAAKQEGLAQEVSKLAKDLNNRRKLLKALKETSIQPEAQPPPEWQTIIENLPPDSDFSNSIRKTAANPNLSQIEKEAILQKEWEGLLGQQTLPATALEGAKELPLSLETFSLLAEQLNQPANQRVSLTERLQSLSQPLRQEQALRLKETLEANLVSLAPLAKDLGWERVAKTAALQAKEEFKGIPLEKIYPRALRLAKEAEKSVPASSLSGEASLFSPLVMVVNEKLVPFVGLYEISGNPWGNHWQTKHPDLNDQPKKALFYCLTTSGVPAEELEKLGQIQQRLTGDPQSLTSQQLFQLANELRQFQTQYFSQEPTFWQINRVRQIFTTFRPTAPLGKIVQGVKNWFFKTGAGQAVKLWLRRASQKSLEALWATAKTGARQVAAKGIAGFLTKIGLASLLNIAIPGGGLIATALAAAGEWLTKKVFSRLKKVGGFITSGFGLGNLILGGITGQWEPAKDEFGWVKWVAIGPIALIAFLTFFTNNQVKDSALLGRGGGGPPSAPGLPVAKPPECQAPRHLAEEVICLLTHPPCNFDQNRINWDSRSSISNCLNNVSLAGGDALMGLKEVLQYYHCYDSAPGCPPVCQPEECPLQCLQFVIAITEAIGQNINRGFDHAGLYADDYPSFYKKVAEPNLGDIAVWRGIPGHIGIVISTVLGPPEDHPTILKLLVAEANFDLQGGVGLIERPPAGMPGGPSVYLRFCSGGNCQ